MSPAEPRRSDSFDWQDVKTRLARVQRALEGSEQFSEEKIEHLMRQRAQQLAKVPQRQPDTSELLEVVRFRLGKEEAAIETEYVLALTHLKHITTIPGVAPWFAGVTNLRGEITTVIDLAAFLQIEPDQTSDSEATVPQALVLGGDQPECAVLVDGLHQVTTLARDQILEPAGVPGMMVDLLLGNTPEAIMILDGGALLACEKLFIDQSDS